MWMSPPQGETRRLLRLAIPVTLSSVGNMLMGIVDTMIVGHYSSLDLAGVAAGNSVSTAITVTGVGFLAGMDPIVSQAYGAGDKRTGFECLAVALQEAILFAILASLMILLIARYFAWTGADHAVVDVAQSFLYATSWSILPYMLYQGIQRYWQALEVTLPFTLLTLLGNLFNFAFAWLFVNGYDLIPRMGGRGVAWATTAVRILSLLAGIGISVILWQRQGKSLTVTRLIPMLRHWNYVLHRRFFRLGCASAAHVGLEVSAFSFTTLLVARLGAGDLATHQIVLNIASFVFMIPLGLSVATAIRVGFHYGAKQRQAAMQTGWFAITITTCMMFGLGLILFLHPKLLLTLFTKDSTVITLGVQIITICALFQVFDGVQVVTAGILRGLGDTKTALISNLVAHWGIGIPSGIMMGFVFDWGLRGLWIGLALGLCLTAALNSFIIYRRTANELTSSDSSLPLE